MTKLSGKRPYACSEHAKKRAQERLGINFHDAHGRLMNYMQTADYRGATSNSRIFDHYKSRTRLVLDPVKDLIITVYSLDEMAEYRGVEAQAGALNPYEASSNPFIKEVQTALKREASKMRRIYIRQTRQLTEQIAVIGLEIAQLTLNKARARSPITQEHIQRKIDDLHAEAMRLDADKKTVSTQYNEAKAAVGGEVTV